MNQYQYTASTGNEFRIIDVGGQRAERKKWINYFDKLRVFCYRLCFFNFAHMFVSFLDQN